jgi:hypothetical protein
VPPPSMGWTMKIYHKARGDAVSHHRLVGMLSAYFADWHPAVEYVCWEYTCNTPGVIVLINLPCHHNALLSIPVRLT